MPCFRTFLGTLVLMPYAGFAQSAGDAPAAFTVAYVETRADAAAAGRAALEEYRATCPRRSGCVRIEVFALTARPGHFAVLETWRDPSALDAHDPEPKRALLAALEPIRVSGYDERVYKPLAVAATNSRSAGPAVYVITHVDVAPNTQAPELLARLAEASRAEPGNLRFDVVQLVQRANHFTVIEAWRDQAALDSHVAAAPTRTYRDELQPLTGSPLDERLYSAVGAR
jgi:quinol monooxygenase YgiN